MCIRDSLKIDTNLLDQQEKVEKLASQTGGYEEKEEDLPGLKVRAATIRRELEQLGKKLPAACPLDDSGQSALTIDQQERIRELATARTTLDSDQNHASKALEEAITTLTVQQAELSKLDEPTDVAALMEVIARIRKTGDLDATRTETSRKPVSYTHLRAHETVLDLVCRLLLEKKTPPPTPHHTHPPLPPTHLRQNIASQHQVST